MAAGRYSVALEQMLQGEVDLLVSDIRLVAIGAGYVADLTADGYYAGAGSEIRPGWLAKSDGTMVAYDDAAYAATDYAAINTDSDATGVNNPLTNVIGISAASLSTKTVDGGRFDAADPLFVSLPGAKTITQFAVTLFDSYTLLSGFVVYRHLPLALITKKQDDTDISFDTGGGLDLLVRFENVAPYVFEV